MIEVTQAADVKVTGEIDVVWFEAIASVDSMGS